MTLRVTATTVVVLGSIASQALSAQCRVGKETNEAKLLAYYAVPMVFSPSGNLGGVARGQVRIGFDATLIPSPGDNLRKTRVCFLPKDENSQLSPIFPRPHVTVGIGGGAFVEAMYLPPVTVADATPSLFSVALGMTRPIRGNVGYAVRGHLTGGNVKGPITCNHDALQLSDQNKACYGTAVSDDEFEPGIAGVEGALTWKGSGKLRAYGGLGATWVKPRFQVGFTDRNGFVDSTIVTVGCAGNPSLPCPSGSGDQRLTRLALMLGGAWALSPRVDMSAELYSVSKDMTTLRVGGAFTLGRPR